MSEALHKLIDRKRKFLETCTNERTAIALRSEINILQNTIEEMQQAQEQKNLLQKTINAKADEVERLIIICNLHGIDLKNYVLLSKGVLLSELKRDRAENMVRVPHLLKNTIQP
jgi:hypothetical protein